MRRVVIAEDSPEMLDYLIDLLSQDPAIQVVGTAASGIEAVVLAGRLNPDLVLMDINMPTMNGYEATRRIMERSPTPIVMVSAALSQDEVAMSMEALRAGALTILPKPGLAEPEGRPIGWQLVETVECLAKILRELPGNFAIPILLVQHISGAFTRGLADWLGRETRLHVKVGEHGERVLPKTAYLAPDGFQMAITPEGRISLATGCRKRRSGSMPPSTYSAPPEIAELIRSSVTGPGQLDPAAV